MQPLKEYWPHLMIGLWLALGVVDMLSMQADISTAQAQTSSSTVVTQSSQSSSSSSTFSCSEIRTKVDGVEYVTQKCTMANNLVCVVVIGPSGVSQNCYTSTP